MHNFFFRLSKAGKVKDNGQMWPEFEFVRDFTSVLVIGKFEDNLIKTEGAIVSTTFSLLEVYGENFRQSRANNSNSPIRPKIELVPNFMPVLVTCKFEDDPIKTEGVSCPQHFPNCKSMGAFDCHGNQGFDPICPKTLRSLSPTPVMLHISLKVWTTDHCYTISSPCEPMAQVS